MASNKLSGPARAIKELVTGQDWKGQPFGSLGERLKAAALDALPSPLPLSGTLEKDPKATLGYTANTQKGSLIKQGLSMIGIKADAAQSARGQMYRIADKFRPAKLAGVGNTHPASVYADLRQHLDNGDEAGAEAEVRRLLSTGKRLREVEHFAAGIAGYTLKGEPKVSREIFTGSKEAEKKMLASLSPAQKGIYDKAQADRQQNAELLTKITTRLRAELIRRVGGGPNNSQ